MTTSIRRARLADSELLWQWRNDPVVRSNSFNSEVIPWAEHEQWIGTRLDSIDTRIFFLEDDGKPVAQIRYERRDNVAEVGDISVAAPERGKGYGKHILLQTLSRACGELQVEKIVATVKCNNTVSVRTFLAAGFRLERELNKDGAVCKSFTYVCPAFRGVRLS